VLRDGHRYLQQCNVYYEDFHWARSGQGQRLLCWTKTQEDGIG
jgi:hypothetical protein